MWFYLCNICLSWHNIVDRRILSMEPMHVSHYIALKIISNVQIVAIFKQLRVLCTIKLYLKICKPSYNNICRYLLLIVLTVIRIVG